MRFSSIFALATITISSRLQAQSIPAVEAGKHIGENATVCGQVAGKHTVERAKGKPTFVDLEKTFPSQVFTLVVWETDREKVGELPSSGNVCATGIITQYKGTPQMVVHDGKSWTAEQKSASK